MSGTNDINIDIIWKMIHSYFDENPQSLVTHHIESYNDFYANGIQQIFKEKNPIRLSSKYDETINDYRYQCMLYIGGKDGSRIYFGKPVIHDNDNAHYMFPNEARMRNMTYGMTIHYDIEVEYVRLLEPGETPTVIGVEQGLMPGGGIELIPNYNDQNEEYQLLEAAGKLKKEFLVGGSLQEALDSKQGGYIHADNNDIDSDDDPLVNNKTGGAPKKASEKPKATKTAAKRKTQEEKDLVMTAAAAARIRETTAKSLVQPNRQVHTVLLEKIYLGKFPIMVQSNYCILNGLNRDARFSVGECRNDLGGYFIIDGKEKTVVPQEKFADNMLYIKDVGGDDYLYSAEIRSVSENSAKPIRTFSVKMVAPGSKYSNRNLVVNIPNVRKPIPLFIVFRALGIISDKDIISMCLLDLEKYEDMIDLFIPSVYDAGGVLSQQTALLYIASFTKINTVTYVLEILADYFLPHVGEVAYIQKAYYLGYIVFRLLAVSIGLETPTDRDNFKYKRIELAGSLLYDLFKEYYTIQQRYIQLELEKKLFYNPNLYESHLEYLIQENYREVFKERILESGFKKAFKGNWGSQSHTKRIGVVQDLNRLSFNSAMSHLRKTNLPMDASVKLVGPRVLHNSHWGFIDPIDTPDGGNIGLHKQLAITTYISRGMSREPVIQWLREKASMRLIEDCGIQLVSQMTKVIVNGYWAGVVGEPMETMKKIRLFRRNALLPIHLSATFDIKQNTIFIYTDMGRVCRPIFYKDDDTQKMSFENREIISKIKKGEFSWSELISGFNEKKIAGFHPNQPKIYELHELYDGIQTETNPAKLERFLKYKAIVDYIDPSESEDTLIAVNTDEVNDHHTHSEIHESLIFGMMCNQIIFPENNPPVRNAFSTGQSKQAVSMYHTNFPVRMDKTAVVLNNGQIPLVKSRFMEYINHEENPYGENAIVAIMCYTGYNVEDAILINEGALQRGLFRTTYYTTYETHEESSKVGDKVVDKKFSNIEGLETVVGKKPGYDYSKLDAYGLIRENTPINDKTVLIGLTTNSVENAQIRIDESKTPKKGQLGIVDKTFITEGEEGTRIAKVRVREERIPFLGDKMASRAGQKGTIGMVIRECDMPFTKDGIRPDLIINPHALPTRMTIGQLVECIIGKASAYYGAFSDCTAFINKGSKIDVYEKILAEAGFHSQGNEVLYNGMTGEQLESSIFMGPTYYMRLKHMVKDKINYRATGPNTSLTRQPISGRANDGGLRIGEMERDSVIGHGMTNFLRESMMDRADKYQMAICNKSGTIAIYNPAKNLFKSPAIDGPIPFTLGADGQTLNIEGSTDLGRSFSIVSVPYSMKLMMQELQTINMQLRLITDDNIDQMENLTQSKNIAKLLMNPTATLDTVEKISRSKTEEHISRDKTPNQFDSPDYQPEPEKVSPAYEPESPKYPDVSPAYEPESSPQYQNVSPAYEPTEEELSEMAKMATSPPYIPSSPDVNGEIEGGGGKDDFHEGEIVYLRGGKNPKKRWNVKHVGNKFVTIDAIDPSMDDEDDLLVVTRQELMKEGDIPEVANHNGHYDMFDRPMIRNGENNQDSRKDGIIFAPNIVVNTGNENTIGTNGVPQENMDELENNTKPIINKTGGFTMSPPKQISESVPEVKPDGGQAPSISNGFGIIDFAKNFIIKKTS
jgi:DNA-directed RNA polymerase II subunit RPB2